MFTSTTSAFGRALTPAARRARRLDHRGRRPVPRNVYGATKVAAEDLCELVHRDHGLPVLVLRTSRFFPEADDRPDARAAYEDANLKANELLHRRVDLEDVVDAHLLALERAPEIGFGRYIVSATTPFTPRGPRRAARRRRRRRRPPRAGRRGASTRELGWRMPDASTACTSTPAPARSSAGGRAGTSRTRSTRLAAGRPARSELAAPVGAKGYHAEPTGVYTT